MGEFLALLRKANGFTQQDVAEKLNISNKTLSSWETDRTTPDILLLPAIADLYGVSVNELLRCERNVNDSDNKKFSEEALRSQRKHKFGKYAAKCLLFSGLGGLGAVILALAFVFLLYTFCTTWIFVVLVVLATCDIIACTAILFYNLYDARLAEGLVWNEDYTEEKKSYALALKAKTGKFFLFCALPLIAFALVGLIVFFAADPQHVYVGGINIDYSENHYAAMGVCGGLGIAFLIAYFLYANVNYTALANAVQAANHKHNAKFLGKTVGFGAIPVVIALVLLTVFICVQPRSVYSVYFTANSVDEVKQKLQTIDEDGEHYLNFNTDEKNEITFSYNNTWGHTYNYTLYDLGNGFYGEKLTDNTWTVYQLDGELPPAQLPEGEAYYTYFTIVAWELKYVFYYSPTSSKAEKAVNVYYREHDTVPEPLKGDFISRQGRNVWYYNEEGVWRYELDVWYDYSEIFLWVFIGTACSTVTIATIIYIGKRKKQIYNF